jgi:hypothetical protein
MPREECRTKLGESTQSKIGLFEYQSECQVSLTCLCNPLTSFADPFLMFLCMMPNASSEEVRLMLNAANCLPLTSLHEGFPNIV